MKLQLRDTVERHCFTLVEIMIVVAILGVLASLALPSFMKARESSRRDMCINNMRVIEYSKEQSAFENNGDVATYLDYIKDGKEPTCPTNDANYVIGDVNTLPTCPNVTLGHVLTLM